MGCRAEQQVAGAPVPADWQHDMDILRRLTPRSLLLASAAAETLQVSCGYSNFFIEHTACSAAAQVICQLHLPSADLWSAPCCVVGGLAAIPTQNGSLQLQRFADVIGCPSHGCPVCCMSCQLYVDRPSTHIASSSSARVWYRCRHRTALSASSVSTRTS